MKKTHQAFLNNVGLFKGRHLYLWTFTFPSCIAVSRGCAMWSDLAWDLVRHLGFVGLRVFEMHQRHGLHIHALTDRYMDVNSVRSWARWHGFGRIHVKRIARDYGAYIGKYLSKGERPECLKGRRLWATFGKWAVKSLVASILVYSSWTVAYRSEECHHRVRSMGYDLESPAGRYARMLWATGNRWRFWGCDVQALMRADLVLVHTRATQFDALRRYRRNVTSTRPLS